MPETYRQRDELLLELGFSNYADYLRSGLWMRIRSAAFALHGTDCRLCKSGANLIHHISYRREVLVGENLSELVPLCDGCHYKVEFTHNDRKRSLEEARTIYRRLLAPRVKTRKMRCIFCGNKLSKKGGPCKSCRGTGVTGYPTSRKARLFLDSLKDQ